VGSRPAKRNPKGGVESLRAIPWIFAWAQTRLNLPVWLGIGKALDPSTGPVDLQTLRKMYKEWPWFNTTIDLIEMIMAKSERAIAEYYDRRLVQDPELLALGQKLRERFQVTEQAVLDITEHTKPQTPDELESLRVRNHLMDVLNIIQVETLLRLRAAEAAGKSEGEEHDVLKDALLVTINGIATGMRNSA
jgi:phosphoenolpyruvate carboxylase